MMAGKHVDEEQYEVIKQALRLAYDAKAEQRDRRAVAPWKDEGRRLFLDYLLREGRTRLLEIGAGPGSDSWFFHNHGLQVISTDLSPEMVRLCRSKGLEAHVMDFSRLQFPAASFDAVYALNCLLHVPSQELPRVLAEVSRVLRPGGLFYVGLYGGIDREGPWVEDSYLPPRFFVFYSDARMKQALQAFFDIEAFNTVTLPDSEETGMHFQRFVLRRRSVTTSDEETHDRGGSEHQHEAG